MSKIKLDAKVDGRLIDLVSLYAYQHNLSFEAAVEHALRDLRTDLGHWCTFCGLPNCEKDEPGGDHSHAKALASVLRGEKVVYRHPWNSLDRCSECKEVDHAKG